MRKYISEGYYAFQDYAVVHWVDHLISSVEEIDALDSESLLLLESLVGRFIKARSTDLPVQISRSEELISKFRQFSQQDYFDKLIQVVTQATSQKDSFVQKDIGQTELSYLAAQIELVRSNFERMTISLSSTSAIHGKYEIYYGSNWYKCPRIDCTYFYRGFPGPADRDRHENKHNRPFHCSRVGCHIASIGCRTAKELNKHELEFHSTSQDLKGIFPAQRLNGRVHSLCSLASKGDLEAVELWLENMHNKFLYSGKKALTDAASKGHDAVVRRLLRCDWSGWSQSERSASVFAALQEAVFRSREATFMLIVTEKYIQSDSDVLCDGRLLLTAARNGCGAMVSLLQQRCHNLNYNFRDLWEKTPIM